MSQMQRSICGSRPVDELMVELIMLPRRMSFRLAARAELHQSHGQSGELSIFKSARDSLCRMSKSIVGECNSLAHRIISYRIRERNTRDKSIILEYREHDA